ncbi:MAG TPA: hypothetical protein VGX24_14220 [Pyrinomonadaceae bacterium]|jgi:hypothetical protein|nr:hypothetical protein [Pyrinomonadaceae bacterium]
MSSAILDQPAYEPSKALAPYAADAETYLEAETQTATGGILSAPLAALVESLKPASLSTTMHRVFTDLARLLDYLRLIEKKVQQDQLLASTFSVFTNIHKESLALIEQIDADMLHLEGASEELLSTLDGISYAIGHEIGRVYGFELVGINDPQSPPIRAKLERAHGLLRNCFQQSTITLTQVFDPMLDGEELFNDFQARREEALILYRDLWNLVGLARRADMECDQFSVALLLAHLKRFRDGSMCYLMYRDWEEYERFVKQVTAARRILEIGPALEGLACYLETLLGQVRLRSVLTNVSFIVPDTDNEQ